MAPAECAVGTPTLAIGSERRDKEDIAELSRQGGIQTVTIRRAVALANRLARIAWAVLLRKDRPFDRTHGIAQARQDWLRSGTAHEKHYRWPDS